MGVAVTPPIFTKLAPCVGPKLVPVIVTGVPAGPDVGFKLVMFTGLTVKLTLVLAKPPTVTTTGPVVAPVGTGRVMPVSIQLFVFCRDATVPLNVTVSPGTKVPKFVPLMRTDVPTGPNVGLTLVTVGVTVKGKELPPAPLTMTTTLPVVAPDGTGTMMLVALQLVGVAGVMLNETELVPCDAPKFVPAMVTEVPTGPDVGFRLVMLGATVTVKVTPLLATPPTVTTTLPVVAPVGTGTAMLVVPQLVGVAVVPLNVTVLVPCVAPKFAPAIVTDVPTGPDVGFRLVMLGAGVVTAKFTVLLATPPTVTTTPPEVAPAGTGTVMLVVPQLVGAAFVPLNFTVLVPWVAPKFAPRIVTEVPAGPDVGFREAMLGTVPPPLPAARKATICMIHDWILSRTAVAL